MSRSAKYDVTVYLSWRHNPYAVSKILIGLMTADSIRCRLAGLREMANPVYSADPLALFVRVAEPDTGRQVIACIELWDHNDYFAQPALDRCDVYFKRSYLPARVAELPAHFRDKVAPFGLNYACNHPRTKGRLIRRMGMQMALAAIRSPRQTASWARHEVPQYKQFLTSPYADAYEKGVDEPAEPLVLLQTRVWAPDESYSAHTEQINEERAAMVRTLRDELGDRFVGGLAPTPHAKRAYSELVTTLSTKRPDYAATIGRCLIGIYVRGVHDSIAFKLPEYLAASRCIVAEPLINEIPEPLVEGVNIMGFITPEECVAACRRILDDTDLQSRMREANYRYYTAHVEPHAHVLRLLDRALDRVRPKPERAMERV